MNKKQNKAFTLIEVLVTIIIIGVLAGLAFPQYFKTVDKAREDDARTQLRSIHAANDVLKIQSGSFWPTKAGLATVGDINSSLHLNIVENGMQYKCAGDGTSYVCAAVRIPSLEWSVAVTEDALSESNPFRQVGECVELTGP